MPQVPHRFQAWMGIALLASLPLAAHAAPVDRPLRAETPVISAGGDAAGRTPEALDLPAWSPSPWRPATTYGAVGTSFTGFAYDDNFTENGFRNVPPEPSGAAGTDRLIAVVSSMIEARSKTGTLLYRDALKDFFAPLAGCAVLNGPFDPKVVYDTYAGRFLVLALERVDAGVNPSPGNKSRILIAVSKNGTPATATAADWWFTCIDSKVVIGGSEYWADFPGFVVDEEALYVTANLFTFTGVSSVYGGSRLWILPKGTAGGLYAGGAATVTLRDPYLLAGTIATTTMPALVLGAGGAGPGIGTYLVSYSGITDGASEYVQVIRVDDPLGAAGGPTFVGPDLIGLGDLEQLGGSLPDAPQPGTAQLVETNDRRALCAVWRQKALWLTMTIMPDGAYLGSFPDHTTAWFVQLSTAAVVNSASPAGLIGFAQQGGIGGEEIAGGAGGAVSTYCSSLAVNAAGAVAIGYCASGIHVYPGAYVATRRAGDPSGVSDPAVEVKAGRDWYVRTLDGPPCDPSPARNAWGECSSVAIDPSTDAGFWAFNTFADLRGSPSTGGCNGRPDPEDGRWGTAWALVGAKPLLRISNGGVAEGNTGTRTITFYATLSEPAVAGCSVSYTTVNGSATTAGADYVATSGTLSIPAGSVTGTITVTVNSDATTEPDETFTVALSSPVNVTVVAGGGIGTIYNDDGTTGIGAAGGAAPGLRVLTPNPGPGPPRLAFELPAEGEVSLTVLDVRGQRVAVLAGGRFAAGPHVVEWPTGEGRARLARGVYFARLVTGGLVRVARIVLL